ncbi:amidohydrolase [Lacihabitans sp. LS3-19]|uniref:amidohydrolase family protein n=1 Tax=Lacihabitans sp. LS3-19 TaxID=2487335 RepID=UPI0020CE2A34|nr:amidohydrolase family protein [Lacihabitans sp. LS3-19]MCP9767296.1 amidohydrolase [Lacihabitans sp. LS3-19]
MFHQKSKFLFILLFGFFYINATAQNQTFLIHHAKIVDVKTGNITKKRAILIENQTIKSIDSYKKLKKQSFKKIDAKGKYIIPGLWDMHIHIEGQDLVEDNKALFPVFLAHGITTVRDAASDLGLQVLKWRDEINEGKLLGPTIYTAGRKLEGLNSIWKGDLEIENEEQLTQMLDYLDSLKVDFVKITENTLKGDLFLKSVIEAKKRGYKVTGHVPYDLTINDLAEEGFSAIEHASYLLRLGNDEISSKKGILDGTLTKAQAEKDFLQNFDQEKAIKAYSDLANKNVAVCPTLIGGKQLAYLDENDHKNDDFQKYLTKRFMSNYQWRIGRMANETPEQKQQRKDRYQLIAKQLPYVQKSGMTIIAGSDCAALNTFVYPAASLIEELDLFQKSGMKPLEILQSATLNGAKFMGKFETVGSIDIGKIADLVILEENPLEDINAVSKISGVFTKGKYFNKTALNQMLEEATKKKAELDKSRE